MERAIAIVTLVSVKAATAPAIEVPAAHSVCFPKIASTLFLDSRRLRVAPLLLLTQQLCRDSPTNALAASQTDCKCVLHFSACLSVCLIYTTEK